jgi:hypothetical protein
LDAGSRLSAEAIADLRLNCPVAFRRMVLKRTEDLDTEVSGLVSLSQSLSEL